MALDISTQTIEIERIIGTKSAQALTRAEALVPGAGREAIEVLLTDAAVCITNMETQTDRIIVEGALHCQATYRQGDETTLRAVAAQAQLSQVFDIPGATQGMSAYACANVEHVEARYENGHMVFLVTTSLRAQAASLTPVEVITAIEGAESIETEFVSLCSCKTAAETEAASLVRAEVALPAALDARTTLMDRAVATVESAEADLGGVRVKGIVNVEALISSGVEGHPAASVRYALDFDQLVDVPEWLAKDVCATACVTRLETRVEQAGDGEDSQLVIDAEVGVHLASITNDCVDVLTDAYATAGNVLKLSAAPVELCADIACLSCTEQVKGTLLLSENAPGVGNVIAVTARPNISGWGTNGESTIEGVIEATILYMPGGGDRVVSAQSELPFSIKCRGTLNDTSLVCIKVTSAEASAIMSDRVELRCTLVVESSTRMVAEYTRVTGVEEGANLRRCPGIILFWPGAGDNLWTIGRRYSMPVEMVKAMNGGSEIVEQGKAMVLKI